MLDAIPIIVFSVGQGNEATQVKATVQFQECAAHYQRAGQEKEAFRLLHGLIRQQVQRSSLEANLSLVLMTGIESAVNAAFFLNAHLSAELMAALMSSTLISATNVCLSTFAGYTIGRSLGYGKNASQPDDPEFIHIRRRSRILSGIYGLGIVFFHLSAGCIRAQERFDIDHGRIQYLEVFTTPESLFLVIAGGVMSALAWMKRVNAFYDPYPGYGDAGRAEQDRLDDLHDAYDEAIETIEDQAEEEQAQLQGIKTEQLEQVQQHNTRAGDFNRLAQELRHAVEQAAANTRTAFTEMTEALQSGGYTQASPAWDEQLIRFDHYLPGDAPSYCKAPDFTPYETQIHQAKNRAIRHITEAYRQVLGHTPSDTQSMKTQGDQS